MEIALPLLFLAILVAVLRAISQPRWRPHHCREARARDRLDRQVAHYRASGALPHWDS